ncbi:uncharacterized protein LOC127852279 [Dreissena polymorpha]|uniref:NADH dehydrogenase [ubiquinone] 1 beta subcomplex subunit 4 n=1 Tax=Dreissena polymorpha TaxID=45954 RepID=A0A9D4HU37_DREPO|nr:uncharacterized protein LOC127852279 [Dreissena polymorpha]KAH3729478.1 hypothetical protein DPMN_055450 [Dreissena polymorpha]
MPPEVQKWDPKTMFNLSQQELDIIAKRKAMVQERKQLFRVLNDPRASGFGGTVFDPAMQRWYSARHTYGQHFKATRSHYAWLWGALILPVGFFTYFITKERNEREARYRRGEVSTKDKPFKNNY